MKAIHLQIGKYAYGLGLLVAVLLLLSNSAIALAKTTDSESCTVIFNHKQTPSSLDLIFDPELKATEDKQQDDMALPALALIQRL